MIGFNIKVGDRVNGHIINFVGDCFLEYGNGRRISRRKIRTYIPSELIKACERHKNNTRVRKRYHSDEKYRQKVLDAGRKYRNTHREQEKERNRKYRETHKDEIRKIHKHYVETHREQINAYRRERYRKRKEANNEAN